MFFAPIFHVWAFCHLFLTVDAIPMKRMESHPRLAHEKRTSYSVVAVDGSSPLPLSDVTTPNSQAVAQIADSTKAAASPGSTFTSSIKTIISTKLITELATPKLIVPTSTVTSISTLRITAVEFRASVSVVTEHASNAVQPTTSYDAANPAETAEALRNESSSRSTLPNFAKNHSTTREINTKPVSTPTSSSTLHQSSKPISTYTPQSILTSIGFDTGSRHGSYPYLNVTSSAAYYPCKTGASTGIATASTIPRP